MKRFTSVAGSIFVVLLMLLHLPVGPSLGEAQAEVMQRQSREARSSGQQRAREARQSRADTNRQRTTRARGAQSNARERGSERARTRAERRTRAGQQATNRTAPQGRARTQSRRPPHAGRSGPPPHARRQGPPPHARRQGPPPHARRSGPPVVTRPYSRGHGRARYRVLRPRAPRFASFHLHVHIHRIIGHAPRRVAIRTFDERLLAYEVAQDFVLDHLPRSRRASFPRYRPNSDRVMVEYLGRGAYLVAGEVTTRSRVTGRRRHRAFEVIVEQNHRGWELVEIYLER